MIRTPADIINQALKRSGVLGEGQTASAEMQNDAFDDLNELMALFARKRWLCHSLTETAVTATGANTYTIGPNGDFDVARPDRIEAAFVRLLPVINNQPFDSWLNIIAAPEDYAAIALKEMQSYPMALYYDSQYPLGYLHPYPVPPEDQYEVHVFTKTAMTQFNTLTDSINLPPEYNAALSWSLASVLAPSYGKQPDPTVVAMRKVSLNTLRQANMQVRELQMPRGVPLNGGAGWPPWWAGMLGGSR